MAPTRIVNIPAQHETVGRQQQESLGPIDRPSALRIVTSRIRLASTQDFAGDVG